MTLLVDDLLAPVSEDSPTGEDLFEDPQRQEIDADFEAEAGSVDWRQTVRAIVDQSKRSKDVWLAVYLMRAGAQLGQLDTIVAGSEWLAGLFETYWPTMHPSLDDYGFQGRKGPCESLTRIGPFLGPLRRTTLIAHPRLGSFSGEDLVRFQAESDAADGYGMFRHAVQETDIAEIQASMAALDAIKAAVRRADVALMANAGSDTGTDFTATYEALDSIRNALAPYAGVEVEADEQTSGAEEVASSGSNAGGPRIGGRVDSREDVVKALDAISDYYARREPGSPVPVAVRRVRAWVTMDFMAVLKDIAPNSLTEAETVLVSRVEEGPQY